MKKIVISIMSVLLLSMAVISCNNTSNYSDMDVLEEEDLEALVGYWSGVETHDIKGGALTKTIAGSQMDMNDVEIEHKYYSEYTLKDILRKNDTSYDSFSSFENCIYASPDRTKMVIEEIHVVKIMFNKTKYITTTTLTLDDDQSDYWY